MMSKGTIFCMSGGALRGMECHTGILQACEQFGLKADSKLCVSAGSVIGTFSSAGYSGIDIEKMIRELSAEQLFTRKSFWNWSDSLYDNTGMYNYLNKYLGDNVYPDVKCAVTDDITNKSLYLTSNKHVIMASSAVPGVFEPVELNNRMYRDGGIRNNIPTPKGNEREIYDKIIIFITNEDTGIEAKQTTSIGKMLQWLDLTTLREYDQIVNDWEGFSNVCIIKPPDFPSSLFSWSENHALIGHAREYALKKLEEFLK